jgi:hypothetical protein
MQGAAEANGGYSIKDELDSDGEPNEPQAYYGELNEQKDAERRGDQSGKNRPAPARKPQDGSSHRAKNPSNDEE